MKPEDAYEIRRLCNILNKEELTTAFLRIAGRFNSHYQIESTLQDILQKKQEEKEAQQEKAEAEALRNYEDMYKEMRAQYGIGFNGAPLTEKIELMTRLARWSDLVVKGVKMTKKHDEELFGGKNYDGIH